MHDRLRGRGRMIAVTGEALIDLVTDSDGCITPQPGGGPFNTARAIGRLGLAPAFLGRLSTDRLGQQLRASLGHDRGTPALPPPTPPPPPPPPPPPHPPRSPPAP